MGRREFRPGGPRRPARGAYGSRTGRRPAPLDGRALSARCCLGASDPVAEPPLALVRSCDSGGANAGGRRSSRGGTDAVRPWSDEVETRIATAGLAVTAVVT